MYNCRHWNTQDEFRYRRHPLLFMNAIQLLWGKRFKKLTTAAATPKNWWGFVFFLFLAFFSLAHFSELERICIFLVSQRRTASTSSLFLFSIATSSIVFLINSINSLSNRKDVLSFQKPGPPGLLLLARWIVIRGWYHGKISAFVIAVVKLAWTDHKIVQTTVLFRFSSPPGKNAYRLDLGFATHLSGPACSLCSSLLKASFYALSRLLLVCPSECPSPD